MSFSFSVENIFMFVFQFSPVVNRCIGVFGLSLNTGEKEIREILEEYGRVEEIQVVYDRQVGVNIIYLMLVIGCFS